MSNQEAIEKLRGIDFAIFELGKEKSSIEMAIMALQKQVPQKPIYESNAGIRYTDSYKCPSCGGRFTGTGIADYCYHCGQALKWEVDVIEKR